MVSIQAQNRRKGARFETDLLKYLREEGFSAERLRLSGKNDEGDLAISLADQRVVVIEAKNAAMSPASFINQAILEAENYADRRGLDQSLVRGVAIVKKRGSTIEQSYVLVSLEQYIETLR